MLSQHLGDDQHEICRRGPFGERTTQFESDDFRHQHIDWLPQHDSFGFDPADAPADHSQAVDHRGMAVGSNQTVGISDPVFRQHYFGQVFEIHLMHDPCGRWNDAEVAETLLSPSQQLISFQIAFKFEVDVLLQRFACSEKVDLNRVIDDKVALNEWVNLFGIATHANHRIA